MIDFNNAKRQKEYEPPKLNGSGNPAEDFRLKMIEHGFNPGDVIIPHGMNSKKVQRFDIDKKNDQAGWYVFYEGDVSNGIFGSWKMHSKFNWCSHDKNSLSYEYQEDRRIKLDIAEKQRAEEEKRQHAKAKEWANKLWEKSPEAPDTFPYLLKKKVHAHGLKITKGRKDGPKSPKEDMLIVPMRDEHGDIHAYRRIWADGTKKNQSSANVSGHFFTFRGKPGSDKVYICEGFATGATIHQLTGQVVIVAGDTGNMPKVAPIIKRIFPHYQMIIAADHNPEKYPCPGITAAENTRAVVPGSTVIWPEFGKDYDKENPPSDFNDLAEIKSEAIAFQQLSITGDKKYKIPIVSKSATELKCWLKKRPKDREYILNRDGIGWLPKGVVGAIAATGGVGKTFMLIALSVAMARGEYFGPIQALRPLNVLGVFGEDNQEELGRRYWDVTGGDIPDNLHVVSVYGGLGPLMKLDEARNPVPSEGYFWLTEVLKKHPGVDILIFDPKSRFYGLDENSNDHATQWIQCLESVGVEAGNINILFATHTSESNSKTISQQMNRGASAIVDGCRWQSGMAPMDEKQAAKLGIDEEDRWRYIIFDTPKNNYSPRSQMPMIFRSGTAGVLEYKSFTEIKKRNELWAYSLCEILFSEDRKYTLKQLEHERDSNPAKHIWYKMNQIHKDVTRNYAPEIIKNAIEKGWAEYVKSKSENNKDIEVIRVISSALPDKK